MLQNIRDNSQSLVAKIIVGLIVVIFAAAGIESLLGNNGASAAADINGEEVTSVELEQAVRMQKRRIIESMGEGADISMLDDSLIQSSALEQLVQQKLLIQSAAQQGIQTSPAAIDQMIVSMPQFQDNGQFSPQLYENVLRSNGYGMAYFKQLLTDDLVVRQLSSGVAGSDFVTSHELNSAAAIIGQKRSYQYVTYSIATELAAAEASESDIQTYYQDNIRQFQREPKSKLAFIELKQADYAEEADEEQIKEAFQLEIADFDASEERKVSHILLELSDDRTLEQATATATDLIAKLDAGESFASLAEAHSDDTGSAFVGGDLGYTKGDAFPVDFEAAVAKAELNQVVGPVETEAGLHLILVTDIKATDKPTYEDRMLAIKQRLELEAAEASFVNEVEQLRDLVFNSADLKEPAQELGLAVEQTDWIGRNDDQAPLTSTRVMNAAFSDEVLKDGNNSEVIELASDHYIVVRVLEHKPAEAKPLAEVEAQIIADIKRNKAIAKVAAKGESLIQQINDGSLSLNQLAADDGVVLSEENSVSRVTAKAPRELAMAIFGMAKPTGGETTVASHSLQNGDLAIVRLSAVEEGQITDLSEGEQQAVQAQLLRAMSSQNLSAYQKSIRDSADITLY